MRSLEEIIAEVLTKTKNMGLTGVKPVILSNAGNLTVRLAPYPFVARIAKLFPGDDADFWREVWTRELKVANHLTTHGVPIVSYAKSISPGPHRVGDTWMTLWDYVEPTSLPALLGEKAVDMVASLAVAMDDFQESLPPLGAWKNAIDATEKLYALPIHDDRVNRLLRAFEQVNHEMNDLDSLFPAHGDAHPGNLLATPTGWRWIDFEDVSLMPRFWDLASFIGNTALFHGFNHPIVDHVVTQSMMAGNMACLRFAMKARVIMSTTTNLSLALRGHGDLDFATAQIERIHDFLEAMSRS